MTDFGEEPLSEAEREEEFYDHLADIPRRVRRACATRDHYRCRRCGSEDNLSLHHVIPRGRGIMGGGFHTLSNLVTVCWWCHMLIEEHKVNVKMIDGDWYFSN